MYNILIVDDEKYIRDELRYILNKIEGYTVKADIGQADDVLGIIESEVIDIVFLDIELRYENGLNVARKINDMNNPPCIILSTAYDRYAIVGYELNVIDYILKPFNDARIERALEKARIFIGNKSSQNQLSMSNKIAVADEGRIYLLSIEEAIYFRADGNNAIVMTKNKSYTLSSSLKKIEERLIGQNFKRISKSHIVNVDKIIEIIPWFNYKCKLKIKDLEEELIVTRNYYKGFKETILIK